MATIRLTILSSIKEQDGRLPILVCISQKKSRAYIKTEFLLDDIAEFDNGKLLWVILMNLFLRRKIPMDSNKWLIIQKRVNKAL